MYSSLQRLNNISTVATSCILALLGAISLSSFFLGKDTTGALHVSPIKVVMGRTNPYVYKEQEFAYFRFSFEADLRPIFHWNTKQLFLYLSAEYNNTQGVTNEVVIWDRIVRRKTSAIIHIDNASNKYAFREISKSFRNTTDVQFVLKYNMMPYVGVLTYGEAGRMDTKVAFPALSSR